MKKVFLKYLAEKIDELLTKADEQMATKTDLAKKVDKVDGKGLSTNDFSDAEKAKLETIHEGAQKNTVTSVRGAFELYKQVGDVVITAAGVGLGNANTRLTSLENNKLDKSEKGATNGVASLDENGRVPSSQLPSYVDDVIEVANYESLPTSGESGKIYITQSDNKTYRWSGNGYAEISASLALGETSATAYAGDKGKKNAEDIAKLADDLDETYQLAANVDSAVQEINERTIPTLATKTEAQGYATTAKSEAITAAASDAQSKANTAESNAKAYADSNKLGKTEKAADSAKLGGQLPDYYSPKEGSWYFNENITAEVGWCTIAKYPTTTALQPRGKFKFLLVTTGGSYTPLVEEYEGDISWSASNCYFARNVGYSQFTYGIRLINDGSNTHLQVRFVRSFSGAVIVPYNRFAACTTNQVWQWQSGALVKSDVESGVVEAYFDFSNGFSHSRSIQALDGFIGNLEGTATKSDTIKVVGNVETNGWFPLVMTNRGVIGQIVYNTIFVGKENNVLYNPTTGALTAAKFIGALQGNADSATNALQLGGVELGDIRQYVFGANDARTIPEGTDFDTLYGDENLGMWQMLTNVTYTNSPITNGAVMIMKLQGSYYAQLLFPYAGGKPYYRAQFWAAGLNWYQWRSLTTDNTVVPKTGGTFTGNITAPNFTGGIRDTLPSSANNRALVYTAGTKVAAAEPTADSAYVGSSPDRTVLSVPVKDGSDTALNVTNLRLPYNAAFFSDIATLPNSNQNIWYRNVKNGVAGAWKRFVLEDHNAETWDIGVASASKLATPRTIWGQSFDGTGDVSGDMMVQGDINLFLESGPADREPRTLKIIRYDGNVSAGVILFKAGEYNGLKICSEMGGWASRQDLVIYTSNNTTAPYAPIWEASLIVRHTGNVGIGTTNPSEKLEVAGNIKASGMLTTGSDAQVGGAIDVEEGITSRGDIDASGNNIKGNLDGTIKKTTRDTNLFLLGFAQEAGAAAKPYVTTEVSVNNGVLTIKGLRVEGDVEITGNTVFGGRITSAASYQSSPISTASEEGVPSTEEQLRAQISTLEERITALEQLIAQNNG